MGFQRRLGLPSLRSACSTCSDAEINRLLCVQIRLLWPAARKGGHRPDPRFPRACRGSARLLTASHGASRLPVRPAVSFAYFAVGGDVLSLRLWDECGSNYVGGPETRLQVCLCRHRGPKGEVKSELYVASRVPVFIKTHLLRTLG